MADLYDETLDDIKQERNFKIFKKTFKILMIALSAALVFSLIYIIFASAQKNKIEKSANNYYQAQQIDVAASDRLQQSLANIQDDDNNYAGFANLKLANLKHEANDLDGAANAYRDIYHNKSYSKFIRDLAFLQYAVLQSNHAPSDELLSEIDAHTIEKSMFKYLLREAKSHALIALGQNDEAKALIQSIINDQDAPQAVVERCRSIISIL